MKRTVIIIVCLVVAAGLVGGALYVRQNNLDDTKTQTSDADKITPPPTESAEPEDESSDSSNSSNQEFSKAKLAQFDGKDGNDCYVAVNGTVYKIEQGNLWNNGQHDTSEGKASCGRDLSEAIKQSPHGTSKLSTLEVVGSLQD